MSATIEMPALDAQNSMRPDLRRGRAESLDALRGLAALSVVILHFTSLFRGTAIVAFQSTGNTLDTLSKTPIGAIWGGNSAVLLFFVLSGFALERMLASKPMTYLQYLGRRICRLWLPYVASLLLGLCAVAGSSKIPLQSEWLNQYLGHRITGQVILDHLLLIGTFDVTPINFVIWSLVHEMRMSLAFPLLYWLSQKVPFMAMVGASSALAILVLLLQHKGIVDPAKNSWSSTAYFQIYFVAGLLIAKHELAVIDFFEARPSYVSILFGTLCLVLYSNCLGVSSAASILSGATGFVALSIGWPRARHFLGARVLQFLGKISYSLYLVHAVVMLALINWLYPRIGFPGVMVLGIPLSFGVASVFWWAIETPSISLGRRLTV